MPNRKLDVASLDTPVHGFEGFLETKLTIKALLTTTIYPDASEYLNHNQSTCLNSRRGVGHVSLR